jgi:type II secretory pathway pseudopilin PulG
MYKVANDNRGFTLVEVTIILLVLVILSAIMLPQMGNFNRLARFVKVKEDLGAICSVLKVMLDDVGESAFYEDPGYSGPPDRSWSVGLLIGSGDTPTNSGGDQANWSLPYEAVFNETTDGGGLEVMFNVDTLGNHLISNTPVGDAGNRWRTPIDTENGFNSMFAWRGPYISDEISSDPWGNRYSANVFAMYNPPEGGAFDRFSSAVVCLSAGPDAHVDTDFNQPFGWETGDDDLTAVLHAGGPM